MHVRTLIGALVAVVALMLPLSAAAETVEDAVSSFTYTSNMHPLGYSGRTVAPGSGVFNSDLAFWGRTAYQGTYEGFRIVDVSDPENPLLLENFTDCVAGTTTGNQGDVIVWENILVRSWNSPSPNDSTFCGGIFTPAGQEGVHVFDVSDPANPVGVAFVRTLCGSHTATGVPDPANNRLLVYNSPSSGSPGCRGIDILQVPLNNPASASYVRFVDSGDPSVGGGLENLVTIDAPSPAVGVYGAAGAAFGPAPTAAGVAGNVVSVNDGVAGGTTSDGCEPFTGVTGSIALVDRGFCNFTVKVKNAQNAGAVGVIVANNSAAAPTVMGGSDPTITIPAVMVSRADGATIRAGLPATGKISSNPTATRSCHDTGVILGNVNLAACAGGNGFTVWSLDPGALDNPRIRYSRTIPGVSVGHSASFSWDGAVLIFGHEPGGGGEARCQSTSSDVDRTLFFFEAATGDPAGHLIHPRPQGSNENCTWHNYNVVPTDKQRILVSGSYQAGISVVDFTDPAKAREIAFADPAPLSPQRTGGDWSTYWYDGSIYESDITRGLMIWNLSGSAVAGARRLGHLNPQTQETSFPFKGTAFGKDKAAAAAAFEALVAGASRGDETHDQHHHGHGGG